MDGILLIDKPKGITSHQAVEFIRRKFRIRRVGHSGTLDPAACGLLIILLGKATKLFPQLAELDKKYEATLTLGKFTSTGDSEGKILTSKDVISLAEDQVKEAFKEFEGEIYQIPPMVSALKYKGKRLYELARKGRTVQRRPRKIHIERLDITNINLPTINFKVSCSKGTYIRTLCEDIAKRLGCGGYMSSLTRTGIGKFSLSEAVKLEEASFNSILPIESVLKGFSCQK